MSKLCTCDPTTLDTDAVCPVHGILNAGADAAVTGDMDFDVISLGADAIIKPAPEGMETTGADAVSMDTKCRCPHCGELHDCHLEVQG